MTKTKVSNEVEAEDTNNESIIDILEAGQFVVDSSGGGKIIWTELKEKTKHREILIANLNQYLDDNGFDDSFIKTTNGQSRTYLTKRRDITAESMNNFIEAVNNLYNVIADQNKVPENKREPPIRETLHVGNKQLSSDVSAFNNTMIELGIPHKWGVRKNTEYKVLKLQRIEREA